MCPMIDKIINPTKNAPTTLKKQPMNFILLANYILARQTEVDRMPDGQQTLRKWFYEPVFLRLQILFSSDSVRVFAKRKPLMAFHHAFVGCEGNQHPKMAEGRTASRTRHQRKQRAARWGFTQVAAQRIDRPAQILINWSTAANHSSPCSFRNTCR